MKRVLLSFLFLFLSCGKDNVRKSNLVPEFLMNENQVQMSEQQSLIHPKIQRIENAKIQFRGNTVKELEYPNVVINHDIHFHKKWIYLAKLEQEQNIRRFNFPIDHIDKRMSLIKFSNLIFANRFTSFPWQEYSEVSMSFNLKVNYDVLKKLTLRNVQVKLFAIDSQSYRYELAEAPLLKYQYENEDIDLETGSYSPNHDYQLEFKLKPEMMYKALVGKVHFGIYVSNMDLEIEGKSLDYNSQWKKEYDTPRVWIKNEKLNFYPIGKDIKELMQKIDGEVEFRNDGQVMYFLQKRSSTNAQWKILKNEKFNYITYLTKRDLASFNDQVQILSQSENLSGEGLVEIKGSVHHSSIHSESLILKSVVNEPRICTRWNRFEKGECIDKDLSCHVSVVKLIENYSRALEENDLPEDFKKIGDVLYAHLSDLSKLDLPKSELTTSVLGIVGIGHCPSQNEEGFNLPGYSPMTWTGESGTRYELNVVIKKPAPFQLWF